MKDNKNNIDKGTIALYKSEDGQVQIDVKLEHETLWLNLNQISSLFGRDKSVISRHINNLYKEKELPKHSTVANFATVQTEGNRRILRQIEHFNLDIIISVGYRVKSKHGTQFRIWANKVLKDYLVNGYVLNEKRLKEKHSAKLRELESSIAIFKRLSEKQRLHQDEFSGVLQVIRDYTHALDTLDKYDHQQLSITNIEKNEKYRIDYKDSRELVNNISEQFTSSSLFGKEKDKSFESALKTIYQTFGKKELYPSLEEKAANLLYMIHLSMAIRESLPQFS